MMSLLSIVIPVYKSEKIVKELVNQLVNTANQIQSMDYEIILVEDYSGDNTWNEIATECELNSRIKGIKLSRNFGQHSSIYAGLCHAKGDWIVVMDCDLQDNPKEILPLLEKSKEGFDIVVVERINRTDNWRKRLSWRKKFPRQDPLPICR